MLSHLRRYAKHGKVSRCGIGTLIQRLFGTSGLVGIWAFSLIMKTSPMVRLQLYTRSGHGKAALCCVLQRQFIDEAEQQSWTNHFHDIESSTEQCTKYIDNVIFINDVVQFNVFFYDIVVSVSYEAYNLVY